MKILFTGGGTGGHVFPIIAVVRELRRVYTKDNLQLFYIGPKDDFGKILLSQEGIQVKTIFAGKIRRYFSFENFIDILFKIPAGIFQAFFHLFFLSPDFIFSKGGYGSLPVVISGWILRVPIFLHESDVTPGLTNRILSRLALEIFVSFPKTEYFPTQKMILVGNPIRKEILESSKAEAKEIFKLTGEKPIILILGGSQGAQRINDIILQILPEILISFEIIHQCGEKNFKEVTAEAKVMIAEGFNKYYHLFSFFKEEELKRAYAVADLIVSRAGSGTIFEIAASGLASILIPLSEAAQNHQVKNAYTYAKSGSCVVIEEANLTPHFFLEKIKYLFFHPEELEKMQKGAREFAKPEAAKAIAEHIINYLIKINETTS